MTEKIVIFSINGSKNIENETISKQNCIHLGKRYKIRERKKMMKKQFDMLMPFTEVIIVNEHDEKTYLELDSIRKCIS
jgi:hypothetical protein